jgi:hypothetical protein
VIHASDSPESAKREFRLWVAADFKVAIENVNQALNKVRTDSITCQAEIKAMEEELPKKKREYVAAQTKISSLHFQKVSMLETMLYALE